MLQDLLSFVEDTILSGLLYHWKKRYVKGKFTDEPTQEEALREKIHQLEQMLGKLTMENEFLKKALQNALKHNERNGSSSSLTNTWSKAQERDVS